MVVVWRQSPPSFVSRQQPAGTRIVAGAATWLPWPAVALTLQVLAVFVLAMAEAMLWWAVRAQLQAVADASLGGRVMSIYFAAGTGLTWLGNLIVPTIAQRWGVGVAFLSDGCAAFTAAGIAVTASSVVRRRSRQARSIASGRMTSSSSRQPGKTSTKRKSAARSSASRDARSIALSSSALSGLRVGGGSKLANCVVTVLPTRPAPACRRSPDAASW